MMNTIQLREWQQNSLAKLTSLNNGNRILLQAPTGAGKNLLLQMVAKHYLAIGKSVLMMVDRVELVNDLRNNRDKLALEFDIYTSQKIGRNNLANDYDVILIDEAHVKPTNVIKQIINNPNNIIIGVTATALSKGLGKIYGKSAYVPCTNAEMIQQGIVLPTTFIINDKLIDTSKLKTLSNGEYNIGDMVIDNTIIGDINQLIDKHIGNHQCLILAPNQKEAMHIKNSLNRKSAIYVSDTKDGFDEFKQHKIDIVITVYALSKGFNHPNIGLIIDCRPLRKSIIEFIQGAGRGTRPMDGKDKTIYIDMCGNYFRFERQYIKWNVSKVVKLDNKSKCCSNCDFDYLKSSLPAKCTNGNHLTYYEMQCINAKCFVNFITEDMTSCPNCNESLSHKCIVCGCECNICNRVCPECFSVDFKKRIVKEKKKKEINFVQSDFSQFKTIKIDYTPINKLSQSQLAWGILRSAYYYALSRGKDPIKTGAMYAHSVIMSIDGWEHKQVKDVYRAFYHNIDKINTGEWNVHIVDLIRTKLYEFRKRNTKRSV